MTTQEKIEEIRKACVAGNRDLGKIVDLMGIDTAYLSREIRLADVLLAIRETISKDLNRDDNEIYFASGQLINMWNLLKDDLRDQSPETIDFIYSLLKV